MHVALTLDVCLTRKPKVRVVSASWGLQTFYDADLAALRDWLGRASPGDYLNADGTILPAVGTKPSAPMTEAQGERIIDSLGELTRELARIRAENGDLARLLIRKLVA